MRIIDPFSRRAPVVFVLLIASLLLPAWASAAANQQRDDVYSMSLQQLMNVKVTTATKRAQSVAAAPAVVNVYSAENIRAMGAITLIDVLKQVPEVETSMGPDGHWRVSIRGDRKDGNILLLVDGRAINNAYDGRATFDFPVNVIRRVEIIRGPGSALYGTNAVAGVINIITLEARDRVAVSVGNHGSSSAYVGKSWDYNNGRVGLKTGFSRSAGANVSDTRDFRNTALANLGTTHRNIREDYLLLDYNNTRWKLSLLADRRHRGPWVGPQLLFGQATRLDKDNYNLFVSYNAPLTERSQLTTSLHYDLVDYEAFNEDIAVGRTPLRFSFPKGGFTRESYKMQTHGGALELRTNLSDNASILAGMSVDHLAVGDYHLARNYQVIGLIPKNTFGNFDNLTFAQDRANRTVSALFGQTQLNFDALSLTLGARLDHYSDFGSSFNPRVGAVYKVSDTLKLKLLYGGAFRAPTFKELYDNTRIGVNGVSGNRHLNPEEARTLDAVVEKQIGRYLFALQAFATDTTHVIGEFDRQGTGARGTTENLGEITTTGVAVEMTAQLRQDTRFTANASRYHRAFSWGSGAPFDVVRSYLANSGSRERYNQPRTRVNLAINWRNDLWQLYLGANYGGRASHNNTFAIEGLRELQIDSYWRFNTNISYHLSDGLNVSFSAQDLGGNKNSDPTGSSKSDLLGFAGLLQPTEVYSLILRYAL